MSNDDDKGGCSTVVVGLALLAAALVVCAVLGAVSWWHERDLRDLRALTRTTATVVDVDQGRSYFRDEYEVRFRGADGEDVQTEVPVESAANRQGRIEVAYDPARPDRVRTVEDWQPMYEQVTFIAVCALAAWLVLALWEAVRGLRHQLR